MALATLAVVLSCTAASTSQRVKASMALTDLEGTTFRQWSGDLGYDGHQIYRLMLASTGCPLIEVDVSGVKLSLMLDSGTATGFVITSHAPAVPHRVEGRTEELNADGSHRGESSLIAIERMSVLGEIFNNMSGSLSDWRMFSSEPFNGTVGLDFFLDRRLTLDYRSGKVGVSTSPLPEKLDSKRYVYVDLTSPPKSQGHILYAQSRVNGHDALVYFDTGYNVSFIDPRFAGGLERVVRPGGRFDAFRERVPLELAGHTFVLNELREDTIQRGNGFELPVALVLGSDVLSQFIVTIDLRSQRLILGVAK